MTARGDHLRVRRAVAADARAVAEVHVASWQAAYAGLLPADLLAGLSVDERSERWTERLAAGVPVAVAVVDEQVVAFAAWGRDRDGSTAGELGALYAHPSSWGSGAGRAVHDEAVADLAAAHDEAVLWVLASNARARAFYERSGWRADGGRKVEELGGVAVEEVRYRRALR